MKKHIIFLSLLSFIAVMLQSCGQNSIVTQQAKHIGINELNYPRIDGSTSSLPIVQEIYKAMYKPEIIDGEKVWSGLPQSAAKTIESYQMLIDEEIDLIIVPDPSEEVMKIAVDKRVELEYIPVCLEALVFIVNQRTGIDNIATEELKSIYTDMQINNWSQLGGQNENIFALSRNEDSGSHALMEKFVLKGGKMNENIDNMIMRMFEMVDNVENFTNKFTGLPLGYTIYYFFQNNKEEQNWNNVKLLSIDGVEPNSVTIASGEYPYSTNYYAVIKNDTPKNSPSRKLISWLLSDEGQHIFTDAGFGNIE